MKTLFPTLRGFNWKIESRFKPKSGKQATTPAARDRGEHLFRLHETQNRVITSIYRISISGLVAIFIILLSFTLFIITDPKTPIWVSYLLIAVELLLVYGFVRTIRDFRTYQNHFGNVSARLRVLLRQQLQGSASTGQGREHRLIASLKPKEYEGWDAKACLQCDKAIELTAAVCQHCGHEQGQILMN